MSIGKGEAFDVERKDFRTRIAELEAENAQLKVGIEQSRSDAISNLGRLISVEAENAKLRALVARAGELDRSCLGKERDAFCKECWEALK